MPPSPLTIAATEALRRLAGHDPDPRHLAAALPAWMEELPDLDRLIALWEWRSGPTPWLWMQHT